MIFFEIIASSLLVLLIVTVYYFAWLNHRRNKFNREFDNTLMAIEKQMELNKKNKGE